MIPIDAIKQILNSFTPPNDLILITRQPRVHREVVDYVWKIAQISSGLMAWINLRENFYYVGPGQDWTFEEITYAACRDAACWLTKRKEKDLLLPGVLVCT